MAKRNLKAGSGSMAGLRWLASVGASSPEAWGTAMDWGQTAVYSHAQRLRGEGWVERAAMTHGTGALFYATRSGVHVSGTPARWLARAPSAVTWPHVEACAWTAAWLTARGREMIGPREMLKHRDWTGELVWHEHGETRRRGHRPDLAGRLPTGETLPIEVELSDKSDARLAAVLALHLSWIRESRTPAVIYVCGSKEIAERVRAAGLAVGLSESAGTIRIELLGTIRHQAIAARADATEAA